MPAGSTELAKQVKVFYQQLDHTADQLDAAMKVADQVAGSHDSLASAASAAGDAALTSAITSFLHTWSYGMQCMKSDAHSLSKNLRSAAGRYKALDDAIARAASGGK